MEPIEVRWQQELHSLQEAVSKRQTATERKTALIWLAHEKSHKANMVEILAEQEVDQGMQCYYRMIVAELRAQAADYRAGAMWIRAFEATALQQQRQNHRQEIAYDVEATISRAEAIRQRALATRFSQQYASYIRGR
jgi:hypothetical protein